MKRVLLIDVDSTIPNLALMKISSYYKGQGAQVGFHIGDPNLVFASLIFKKNKHLIDGYKLWYPNAKIEVGGSGFDLSLKLPDEIERIKPDYDLYPGMDYSLGFTTRGCIRACYFCIVPKKEGKYQRWQHPSEFVDKRFKKVVLLDNNWYADKEWFMETSEYFINNNLSIDANQGMDIRLLTPEIASQLKRLSWISKLHFAFDHDNLEKQVIDGIEMLRQAGFSKNDRERIEFYVYLHDDTQFDSALNRLKILKAHRCRGYLMFNMDNYKTDRIKKLQDWSRSWFGYWAKDFEEYQVNPKLNPYRPRRKKNIPNMKKLEVDING